MKLPEEFATYTRPLLGDDLWGQYVAALEEPPVTSIRRNPAKLPHQARLTVESNGPVAWCQDGEYLTNRPNFTFDPLLHAGAYYVQEASSMFLSQVLRQYVKTPVLMLDLCAAPGGKSTTARTALPAGSMLVSNEPMRQRCQVLAENMQKWGHTDVIVTNNFPADFRKTTLRFDVILTDVPCSGEGMFRKEEEALSQWTPSLVRKCSELQRQIVADAWACLKPGGLLIYSTCTLNSMENEENIRFFEQELGAQVLPVDTDASWNITGSLLSDWQVSVYRFIPGRTKGEGLFMAVMRKPGETDSDEAFSPEACHTTRDSSRASKKKRRANDASSSPKSFIYDLRTTLLDDANHIVVEHDDCCCALTRQWEAVGRQCIDKLRVLSLGLPLAERRGRNWLPCQALALSTALRKEAFPIVDLDIRQAIGYLRKEAIALPDDCPRGIVLVCFSQLPLGFMKNIGNRANNLYPQEWRIRSTHLPEHVQTLFTTQP